MKLRLLTAILLGLILVGCEKSTNDSPTPKINNRTVLVYMIAENSLNSFLYSDISEILDAKNDIPNDCELILYVDDLNKPRIYNITSESKGELLSQLTPEYEYDEDPNSASADVFRQVMKYVETNHKANKYGLVMWSHGSGWIESTYSGDKETRSLQPKTSFGLDNGKNTGSDVGHQMNIDALANALSDFQNIDYIIFDACFMQTIETAYELRNVARYVIGSPAEIPGPGAPYDLTIKHLFSNEFNPDTYIKEYYEYYLNNREVDMGACLSAIDTKQLEMFAESTRQCLAGVSLADSSYVGVQNYFLYSRWRSMADMPDCYDMQGIMMKQLPADVYPIWKEAFDKVVVAKYATPTWYSAYGGYDLPIDTNQYGGVSMFIPLQKYIDFGDSHFMREFQKTAWYKKLNDEN